MSAESPATNRSVDETLVEKLGGLLIIDPEDPRLAETTEVGGVRVSNYWRHSIPRPALIDSDTGRRTPQPDIVVWYEPTAQDLLDSGNSRDPYTGEPPATALPLPLGANRATFVEAAFRLAAQTEYPAMVG